MQGKVDVGLEAQIGFLFRRRPDSGAKSGFLFFVYILVNLSDEPQSYQRRAYVGRFCIGNF
jgi:hypothetical protein